MRSPPSPLVWLCRRGTRELELLLRGYLDQAYDVAPAVEQEAFAALLEEPDPVLQVLFFEPGRAASPAWKSLAERILAVAASEP